jgi:hypothetical protein
LLIKHDGFLDQELDFEFDPEFVSDFVGPVNWDEFDDAWVYSDEVKVCNRLGKEVDYSHSIVFGDFEPLSKGCYRPKADILMKIKK